MLVNPKLLASGIVISAGDHLQSINKMLNGMSEELETKKAVYLAEESQWQLYLKLIAIYFSLYSLLVSKSLGNDDFTEFGSLMMTELFKRLEAHTKDINAKIDPIEFDKHVNEIVGLIVRDETNPAIENILNRYAEFNKFPGSTYSLETYLKIQYILCCLFKCENINEDVGLYIGLWLVNTNILNAFLKQFRDIIPTFEELK